MKLLARLFVLLAIACAPAMSAPSTFEGKVSLKMKSDKKEEVEIRYAMKAGFIRMEPQVEGAQGMAMIFNWDKQRMIMLMPEQSMYMEMPMGGMMGAMMGGKGSGGADAKLPELKKTGRTETILGYPCEEYTMTDKGTTTEMWVTDKLGTFMGVSGGNPMAGGRGGKNAAQAWEAALKGRDGFFPLRVVGRDKGAKETFRMEATSVEPGKLADSLFAPPPNYQKFSMPGFGG